MSPSSAQNANRKPTPLTRSLALQWIDFVLVYWNLLDKDQRDAYLLDMRDGLRPPVITLDEMTDIEISALRQHQGAIIQKYRKKAGMTIDELAVLLRKQKTYFSLVEQGERSLTVVDMYRLMQVLDIPAVEMFKPDISLPKPVSPKED